jgi:uncharacterized membrane protein YvbJ
VAGRPNQNCNLSFAPSGKNANRKPATPFPLKNFSLKNKVVLSSIIALIIILIIVVIPKNKTAPFTKEELESAETHSLPPRKRLKRR